SDGGHPEARGSRERLESLPSYQARQPATDKTPETAPKCARFLAHPGQSRLPACGFARRAPVADATRVLPGPQQHAVAAPAAVRSTSQHRIPGEEVLARRRQLHAVYTGSRPGQPSGRCVASMDPGALSVVVAV